MLHSSFCPILGSTCRSLMKHFESGCQFRSTPDLQHRALCALPSAAGLPTPASFVISHPEALRCGCFMGTAEQRDLLARSWAFLFLFFSLGRTCVVVAGLVSSSSASLKGGRGALPGWPQPRHILLSLNQSMTLAWGFDDLLPFFSS